MTKLVGTAPNQVPTNADLGKLAYQDAVAATGAFAGATVTVTASTTLSAAQNGNLIRITASSSSIISLPAAATGLFYVFSSESAAEMYIKPNGSQTINGSGVGQKLILAAGASGIVSCGTAGTNWSSVGITRSLIIHKVTTFHNTADAPADPARLTGTYTPTLGTQILICVGSASASAPYGVLGNLNNRSGGAGGPSYGEKFISSPASSYAYEICGGGNIGGPSSGGFDRTTKAGGITATRGPDGTTQGNTANTAARAGGTCTGGTVNFSGGIGSQGSGTTGGGGGAGTRAGAGGNGTSSGNTTSGGGTGGNNASTSAGGAAATARNNSTQAIASSTSETYLAGTRQTNTAVGNDGSFRGSGAGPKTVVNFGSNSFTIADNDSLIIGGSRGSYYGGASKSGRGGYVTFVEFI